MIDLKDFISNTLQQIVAGVKDAQQTEDGMNVNADNAGYGQGGNLFSAGTYGSFTRVDFDVAVGAETSGAGKASIKVFGIGAEGGGEHKTNTASRINFSVPVRLPDGDGKRAENIRAESQVLSTQPSDDSIWDT